MKARIGIAVLAMLLAALCTMRLMAQTTTPPSYLAEMPSVDKVMQAMQTNDPDETAARQMAAFTHLKNMVEKLAGPRFPKNQLTAEENKLRQAYYTAYWNIAKSKPQYGPFTAMRGLDISIKFRDELIQKCFPPSFAAEYSKLTGEAIAQNKAFHDQAEQARAQQAAKEQADAQKALDKLQQDYSSGKLQGMPAFQTPEQRALNRCVTAGRPEASCMGNTLLGGFTQLVSQFVPALGKQRPPGPTMSGVYAGAGNWRIDFITDGVLVNCSFLSPNQQNYTVQFKDGRTLVVIDTTPKPLVLTLTADGNLVGPGPVVIDGVVPGGYVPGKSNAAYKDVYTGEKYDILGNKAQETAGYSTFAQQTTTCPAQNLSSKGAGMGIETMEFNVLKMAVGADSDPPIPPGLRMHGMYAAKTGLNVEFYDESVIVACGEPARAYPYRVVTNGSQSAIKVEDPSHPLLLNFHSDGSLDPGSGSYLVHGRRITGTTDDGGFQFAPLEATCELGLLVPGATPGAAAPAALSASAAAPASNARATGAPAAATAAPASVGGGNAAAAANPSVPAMAVPGKPTGNAVLSIVSGFPSAANTPNALAMAPLILLRDTLSTTLSKGGIQVASGNSPEMTMANACRQKAGECQAVNQAIVAGAAAVARAAITGSGVFPGVPPGTYYLMISCRYNDQPLHWDLKVDLKAGANSVTLNQTNAKALK